MPTPPAAAGTAESLVPYAQLYFCHIAHHNVVLRTAYLVSAVLCRE
jgi:hypothetical protein